MKPGSIPGTACRSGGGVDVDRRGDHLGLDPVEVGHPPAHGVGVDQVAVGRGGRPAVPPAQGRGHQRQAASRPPPGCRPGSGRAGRASGPACGSRRPCGRWPGRRGPSRSTSRRPPRRRRCSREKAGARRGRARRWWARSRAAPGRGGGCGRRGRRTRGRCQPGRRGRCRRVPPERRRPGRAPPARPRLVG